MNDSQPTMGPADARLHRRWSRPAIVLTYVLLAILAVAAIWVVDRGARRHFPTSARSEAR